MKSFHKIFFFYILSSFIFAYIILGKNNISPFHDNWLFHGDMSGNLVAWRYFFTDIWRFPIGLNPNYGLDQGSSIIFSGPAPFLSILFKLIKNFLPNNFHFFSIWIFLCFLLQSLFSYLIIKKLTNDKIYAFIGSIFFITSPLFIKTVGVHISLFGQWLILSSLYILHTENGSRKRIYWISIILLSCGVHFYFTIMSYLMYAIFRINEFLEDKNFFDLIKELLIPISFLLPLMFVLGYFSVGPQNVLAYGFDFYKSNLLSLFNPAATNIHGTVLWSRIFPEIPINHNYDESFAYLGLGGLILFFSLIIISLKNIKKINFRKHRAIIFIFLFFFLISLSNKVEMGDVILFEIPLNKYLYGFASIFRVPGRFFWVCYYLILIYGIAIIYKSFTKNSSFIIILILFFIQIVDISTGLKEYLYGNSFNKKEIVLNDPIWHEIEENYEIVSSTLIKNASHDFGNLLGLLKKASMKTEVAYIGRVNRKKLIDQRYLNYNNFYSKKLPENKFYIISNYGHLRHLKILFKNENVGFVLRDNVWLLLPNKKNLMNENDNKMLDEIKISEIVKNKKIIFDDYNSINKMKIFGMGWSYNVAEQSLWSDGNRSTIIFRPEKNLDEFNLILDMEAYIKPKNKHQEIEIFVNGIFEKKFIFTENKKRNKYLELEIKDFENDFVLIEIFSIDPKSPLEIFESPDARKKGIRIHSLTLATQ